MAEFEFKMSGIYQPSTKKFFVVFEDVIDYLIAEDKASGRNVRHDAIKNLEMWRDKWFEANNIEGS